MKALLIYFLSKSQQRAELSDSEEKAIEATISFFFLLSPFSPQKGTSSTSPETLGKALSDPTPEKKNPVW